MGQVVDNVMNNIIAGCRREARKQVQAELKALRAKSNQIDKLMAENKQLKKQIEGTKTKMEKELKELKTLRNQFELAAARTIRMHNRLLRVRELKLTSFVDGSYRGYIDNREANAIRCLKTKLRRQLNAKAGIEPRVRKKASRKTRRKRARRSSR